MDPLLSYIFYYLAFLIAFLRNANKCLENTLDSLESVGSLNALVPGSQLASRNSNVSLGNITTTLQSISATNSLQSRCSEDEFVPLSSERLSCFSLESLACDVIFKIASYLDNPYNCLPFLCKSINKSMKSPQLLLQSRTTHPNFDQMEASGCNFYY